MECLKCGSQLVDQACLACSRGEVAASILLALLASAILLLAVWFFSSLYRDLRKVEEDIRTLTHTVNSYKYCRKEK